MKNILLVFCFLLIGCTLPPKNSKWHYNQSVNQELVCSKKIHILPISINGAKAPQEAFDFSIEKLKKYTTSNVMIHETLNLTVKDNQVNYFIHDFSQGGLIYLDLANQIPLMKAVDEIRTNSNQTGLVMMFTPQLTWGRKDTKEMRGIAFSNNSLFNLAVYNQTAINNSPVISDNQAWKIVLTHILGHHLGVPSASTHNDEGDCTHRECVMYAQPDFEAILSVALLNGMPYDFCELCQSELKNAKKMCPK